MLFPPAETVGWRGPVMRLNAACVVPTDVEHLAALNVPGDVHSWQDQPDVQQILHAITQASLHLPVLLKERHEQMMASATEWAPPIWRLLVAHRGSSTELGEEPPQQSELWGRIRDAAAQCMFQLVDAVAGYDAVAHLLAKGK
eukprot:363637-Chlamydomonas_euryale.AAC.19